LAQWAESPSSYILCKSKKYYTFPRHVDTDNKIIINPNAFKNSNLLGDRIFFSAAEFFRRTGACLTASRCIITSLLYPQADLYEEDEEGSMEYPGESSSMGSFDTLPSRAGPSGTSEILNTDIEG
jgi:hypothetical protein